MHQVRLVEHLTPFDRIYRQVTDRAAFVMGQNGIDSSSAHVSALGQIYGRFLKQASMMAFNDAFFLLSIFLVCILPLVLLMRKGKTDAAEAALH